MHCACDTGQERHLSIHTYISCMRPTAPRFYPLTAAPVLQTVPRIPQNPEPLGHEKAVHLSLRPFPVKLLGHKTPPNKKTLTHRSRCYSASPLTASKPRCNDDSTAQLSPESLLKGSRGAEAPIRVAVVWIRCQMQKGSGAHNDMM